MRAVSAAKGVKRECGRAVCGPQLHNELQLGLLVAQLAAREMQRVFYYTVDAESLLVEQPSIRTMFLALSIFRSCKIFLTLVHSPSVK